MKVWNYVVIMIGIVVLFNAAGIDTGTEGLETLIGMATGTIGLTASNFFDAIFSTDIGVLILGLGASILAGFVLRGQLENFIILPFITGTLIFFVQVFQSIITYSLMGGESWLSWLMLIILAPLTIGYILALVEFFRGSD